MNQRIPQSVLAGLALVAASSLGAAQAKEVTLLFATTNAPNFPDNVQVLKPWAARVNAMGKGVLHIDVRDGLSIANFTNYYSRVVNDVVQISWGVQAYLGKQFERSAVVGLPYLPGTAPQRSIAYWRLYETGLLDAEYAEIRPIMLFAFSQTNLHLVRKPNSIVKLDGLKLITGSKVIADLIDGLGAAPVTLPLTETYQALQRHLADGVVTPWTAFPPFKLGEVTHYHVDVRLGSAAGALFMARKKYQALPAAAQKIIDANSGEKDSKRFGSFWDDEQARVRKEIEGESGHTVVQPSAAQDAMWRHAAERVDENWAKGVPNGGKILRTFRDLVGKVIADKAK